MRNIPTGDAVRPSENRICEVRREANGIAGTPGLETMKRLTTNGFGVALLQRSHYTKRLPLSETDAAASG